MRYKSDKSDAKSQPQQASDTSEPGEGPRVQEDLGKGWRGERYGCVLDGLIMLVAEQTAGVLKVRRAALPQPLCLLGLQIQHIQKGPVALRRCPRPCVHRSCDCAPLRKA